MLDKFLDISTRVFAVALILLTTFLIIKLYQNKYMLVQGQEQTLKNSLYSNKDLEIAINELDIENNEFILTIKNKGKKPLKVEIDSLLLDDIKVNTHYSENIDSHTTLESIVDFEDYRRLDKLKKIDISLRINNIHNIDLIINVTGIGKDEQSTD